MSIFDLDIFDNNRTRVIVLLQGRLLLIPPGSSASEAAWSLPGGGPKPDESLAECARREVLEETSISVRVGRVAFLREWVVPKYVQPAAPDPNRRGHGYGLEVFHYGTPEEPVPDPRPEEPGAPPARWAPLAEAPTLPLWPKEFKSLCQRLHEGHAPDGIVSVLGQLESPWAGPGTIRLRSQLNPAWRVSAVSGGLRRWPAWESLHGPPR